MSYDCQDSLEVNGQRFAFYSLQKAKKLGLSNIDKLPYSLKVLLENVLRHQGSAHVSSKQITAFAEWVVAKQSDCEIAFHPSRVLMQDFTGVPAVVDLAAMRDAMVALGGNPDSINPLCPVDLVIDHSVQVDKYGDDQALDANVLLEMQRNKERYEFLRWGQKTFNNFQVVPPGTGICHQVNLEYLAKVVWGNKETGVAYPDTLVGTDSHTTMVNGLGVLGWGVGGIEAEAAMLGQPISMQIPEVVGVRLRGALPAGILATDLVLHLTQRLRKLGVVGKFVEYFGDGLQHLSLADRATIANMAPEYGATCGIFPIDQETTNYLNLSGRSASDIALVEAYAKTQGMWHSAGDTEEAVYTVVLDVDLAGITTSLAGPKRPQDRVELSALAIETDRAIENIVGHSVAKQQRHGNKVQHGDVVIAAITSCTNTSNPSVMLAAGLLAKNAVAKGLKVAPWVKTSLAPGSKVVRDYLEQAGLLHHLEELGFYVVGYGCTTCIGNSGPLEEFVGKQVAEQDLMVCSVLSGNRNFEGRISPQVKANWLASPPLVVAFALAGTTRIDLTKEAVGINAAGEKIYLRDIWPSNQDIATALGALKREMFTKEYAEVFAGDASWQKIKVDSSAQYHWQEKSTYIRKPPFFDGMTTVLAPSENIIGAHILALLGDSVTTDHISPAGSIKVDSPAGKYLKANGIAPADFNSYGSRRGNHEVMMRGTFANIRIRNEMLDGVEGGYSKVTPNGAVAPIYDVAMHYVKANIPLVVIAGREYGTGSSRDWAAKGTKLLGVKAVVAESYERIHRSNLIGMGVLPLQFAAGVSRKTLGLSGTETINFYGLEQGVSAGMKVNMEIMRADGSSEKVILDCRIDTDEEANYYKNDGILSYVLRNLV
jgi:aconitate hydratase